MALALLWALGLPLGALAQPEAPTGRALRDQFHYDFRGKPRPAHLEAFGPLADEFIKPEAEGLRITLPKDRGSVKPVGLSLPLAVGGDFEITAAVEILKAEEPPQGRKSYGVGVLLSANESVRVGRLVRAEGNQVATWDHWATVADQRQFQFGASPGTGQRGRLRLKRDQNTLHYLWAPDLVGENFEEVHRSEFDAPELSRVRLELNTDWGGGENGALEVRLLELRVRASRPDGSTGGASAEEPATPPRKWMWAIGFTALAVLVLVVLVVVLIRGRRRAQGTPAEAVADQAAELAAGVAFACAGCGTRLKVKAEMAGKKIKCPKCGGTAAVPPS
jgi:hypothetical protein